MSITKNIFLIFMAEDKIQCHFPQEVPLDSQLGMAVPGPMPEAHILG